MKGSLRNLRNSAISFNRNIIQSKNNPKKNFSSLTVGGTPFGGLMRDIIGESNPLNNFFSPIVSDMSLLPKGPTLRVDFFETPTEYTVEAEVPGLTKDGVNLSVDENILRIEAERGPTIKEDKGTTETGRAYHRAERSYGKVVRSMRLPVDADLESVSAKLSEGILSVTMKRLEGKIPKKIDIQVD